MMVDGDCDWERLLVVGCSIDGVLVCIITDVVRLSFPDTFSVITYGQWRKKTHAMHGMSGKQHDDQKHQHRLADRVN